MEELDKILQADQNTLLLTIDRYQSEIISEFLKSTSNDYLQSADKWLNAGSLNVKKFGGQANDIKIFREKILDELEKFLCGDVAYEVDRNEILKSADKSIAYIIGAVSGSIGSVLGVSSVLIGPVIVLLLLSMKKMAVKAWCAMRKETKLSSGNSLLN